MHQPLLTSDPAGVPALAHAFLEHSLTCLLWRPPATSSVAGGVLDPFTNERRALLLLQRTTLAQQFMAAVPWIAHEVPRGLITTPERVLLDWAVRDLSAGGQARIDDDVLFRRVGQMHGLLLRGRVREVGVGGLETVSHALLLAAIHEARPDTATPGPQGIPTWMCLEPIVVRQWNEVAAQLNVTSTHDSQPIKIS
jgi:hypothetical protein